MRDPSSDLLIDGAHTFLVSCLWVAALLALLLLLIHCFRTAAHGESRAHPLVWLVGGILVETVLLTLWAEYQPNLVWGCLGLGVPVFGVAARVLRPRPRRFRSYF